LNYQELQAFIYEIRNWNNIPLSSKNCSVGCIFCKVGKDPILLRFPQIPDITLDDLYVGFRHLDLEYHTVRLGAGLLVAPHSDPFLHPLIYDFICHTSKAFPDKRIRTVTTGSYISPVMLSEMHSVGNFGIELSLVTMQPSREMMMVKSARETLEVLLREAPIRKISLIFDGSVDNLRRDLDYLFKLGWHERAEEILVRRMEHTKYANSVLLEYSTRSILNYGLAVELMRTEYRWAKYTIPILDDNLRGPCQEYFDEADDRIGILSERFAQEKDRIFTVAAPTSSHSYFKKRLGRYQNVRTILVPHLTYGGSVTVSGLLTNNDIKLVERAVPRGKDHVLVLPREMYDREQCDITGEHLSVLQTLLGEVWVT